MKSTLHSSKVHTLLKSRFSLHPSISKYLVLLGSLKTNVLETSSFKFCIIPVLSKELNESLMNWIKKYNDCLSCCSSDVEMIIIWTLHKSMNEYNSWMDLRFNWIIWSGIKYKASIRGKVEICVCALRYWALDNDRHDWMKGLYWTSDSLVCFGSPINDPVFQKLNRYLSIDSVKYSIASVIFSFCRATIQFAYIKKININ